MNEARDPQEGIARIRWATPIAVMLAVVSFAWNPYHFVKGATDQELWLPILFRAHDPALYPRDILLQFFNQGQYTFFPDLMLYLSRSFTVGTAFFLVEFFKRSLAALFMLFFAGRPAGKAWAGIFPAFVLVSLPISNAGTLTSLLESHLIPRALSLPLCLAALGLWCLPKRIPWAIVGLALGATFLIHPLTALPLGAALAAFLVGQYIRRKDGDFPLRSALRAGGGFLLASMPLWIKLASSPGRWSRSPALFDPAWKEIVDTRSAYLFPTNWAPEYWMLGLFSLLLIARYCLLHWRGAAPAHHPRRLAFAAGASLAWMSVGLIFVSLYPIPFVVQIQPLRAVFLLHLIGLALVGELFASAYEARQPLTVGVATLAVVGMTTGHGEALFPYTGHKVLLLLALNGILGALVIAEFFTRAPQERGRSRLSVRLVVGILIAAFAVSAVALHGGSSGSEPRQGFLTSPFPWLLACTLGGIGFWALLEGLRKRFFYKIGRMISAVLFIAAGLVVGFVFFSQDLFDAVRQVGIQDLCAWAGESTPPNALFAFEGGDTGKYFRIFARRSLWYSAKDGAQVVFSRDFALEWRRRRHLKRLLEQVPGDAKFVNTIRHEGIDYYLSPRKLPMPKAYASGEWNVYRVPQ
ncbi:MAG: DUF6798 domain-containing protein [Planctomycetota bacterium]